MTPRQESAALDQVLKQLELLFLLVQVVGYQAMPTTLVVQQRVLRSAWNKL